ncbi:MAG: hypothetical protein PHW66_05705 [Gallionella sp.]|nr:hypothetical protein [Gallionella sp.]
MSNDCPPTKQKNNLRPALVLGSGFHRHVFGSTDQWAINPLYDWHCLVGQVSRRLQVAVPSEVLSPVQRWETLVLRAVSERYKNHREQWVGEFTQQASVVENTARRVVANIIDEASQNYPQSTRAQIPLLDLWGAVISLNFDAAWLLKQFRQEKSEAKIRWEGSSKLSLREYKRLTHHLLMSGVEGGAYRRVWFPNGSSIAPETVRMGLHDYGTAPHSIQVAFSHLKKWERDNRSQGQIATCAAALREASEGVNNLPEFLGESPMPLSWVADFLYRPLIIAGVGLSDQESGLWWLLAQRARNIARAEAPANVYILVGEKDRPDFWRSKPFGIEPIVCGNWDEGWEKMLLKARNFSS